MNSEDPEEFESWGNEFVRGSDPETSHEAAAKLDPQSACAQAYRIYCHLIKTRYREEGCLQGAEFAQAIINFLMARGWPREMATRKGESLRRRLSDLEDPKKEWQLLEVRYDWEFSKNGQEPKKKLRKRGKRQLYYLRPPGIHTEL